MRKYIDNEKVDEHNKKIDLENAIYEKARLEVAKIKSERDKQIFEVWN